MKRKLLFVKIAIGLLASQLHAQTPILQEKETLPSQLKNNLTFIVLVK
ncbi:hypothetical protein QVZ41_10815 [Wenyingzhuangia sp. chi5]|uniref:Uncharacterized protein n=1 Tax=Wenyingzhuangia gilva TaxID=3057677 RepID=A0ABT8VTM0_9FLAO|nr:hypothetical protein [Wenyingzhuangia sp. chi5]MDO3695330.1 hypothetical protein [Wenyingzhuangia sp. chi5]